MKNNKTFFTSDLHFSHGNIIKYCNRPFKDITQMDETMIANWNAVVRPQDTVWVLGDFAFGEHAKFLRRLNGSKYLVRGNHDKRPSMKDGWAGIYDLKELKIEGQYIVLCHYAMRVFNKSHHGAIQLFGHSHGKLPGNSQQLDVGVDAWNFFPVTLEQIKERLATLPPFHQEDFLKRSY